MDSLAVRLWRLSIRLHRHGHARAAAMIKLVNFVLFRALLPFQATVGSSIVLEHHALGVVIHPNVVIGDRVQIWHGVTIASETTPGSAVLVVIEDDVMIGAGATIVARHDQGLRVGSGARIGAGAVVTRDVPPGATCVGVPARVVSTRPTG